MPHFHSFHIVVELLAGISRSSSSRASDCHLHARGVGGPIYDQEGEVIILFRSSQHEDSAGHKGTISTLIGVIIVYVELSSTRPRRRSVDVCRPRHHPCRDACPRQRKTGSSGTSTLG